jgi:hypothetical protein
MSWTTEKSQTRLAGAPLLLQILVQHCSRLGVCSKLSSPSR